MSNYFDEAVKHICESIRFDSSLGTHTSKNPFGKGAADCLNHFLDLATSLGFETHNYDNYVGEVIYGEGEEFAILCHLDVVPAGDGWTKDPFGGVIEDGKIWGRGTTDDKGPAICSLYALKALKDKGFVPNKKIKLIVGCNEESGWGCIEHYNEVAHMPEIGFSPDADFPVIYAEKGIIHLRLHFPVEGRAPFLHLEGGKQANMVCDRCEATPRSLTVTKARELGLTVEKKRIIAYGKSAHGSTPDLGENAILPILKFFEGKHPVIKRIIDCLFDDIYGLRELEDETGKLTMSPNVIKFRKGQILVLVDIRYPATIPAEQVFEKIKKMEVVYENVHMQAPLYHDKNSELIQTLLSTYEECTGKKAEPIAIGGGTYARALKQGVGFGPEMPGDTPCIHMADEYISLDRVQLLLDVYEKAIERLTK